MAVAKEESTEVYALRRLSVITTVCYDRVAVMRVTSWWKQTRHTIPEHPQSRRQLCVWAGHTEVVWELHRAVLHLQQ